MRVSKHPIVPGRIRRPPREGFSWIDRRFVREGAIERLGRDEILLYFFLVAVADQFGLSYWSDWRTSHILKVPPDQLDRARLALVRHGLVAYRAPLYQVLDIRTEPEATRQGGTMSIREILRNLAAAESPREEA